MKWNDLTLKERKQIYDSVRKDNPNTTYFEIKSQFDEIPEYEDGGKKISTPDNTFGTKEYFDRQRRISGAANVVQPEVYLTPAGYVKDAIDFAKDIATGDYSSAAIDVALNAIPWGVGKGLKKLKSKVNKVVGTTDEVSLDSKSIPAFTPTVTVKKGKAKMSDVDAAELQRQAEEQAAINLRRSENQSKYDKELSKVLWDAYGTDWYDHRRVREIDKQFGTSYHDAYKQLLKADAYNRGKYIKFSPQPKDNIKNIEYSNPSLDINTFGKTEMKPEAYQRMKEDPNFVPKVEDFIISLNPDRFNPGTVAHELGHVTDAIVNKEFSETATNNYLDWLLDRDNAMSPARARAKGVSLKDRTYQYLTRPTEAKSHMLQMRRELLENGEIGNLLQPIEQEMIERHIRGPKAFKNPTLIDQYRMYDDKNRFIQRLNQLTPIQYAAPIGLAGFAGYNINKDND